VSKIDNSVSLAHALGAEVVVVHLPYFWQWGYARWIRCNLNMLSRASDITIAVENAMCLNIFRPLSLSFFNSLGELKYFDNLVFDTSHFAIARIDILEAWEELKDQVCHIHLSNNYMKGFDDHALPFEGRLPLDRFLVQLRNDGYQGKVTLELGPGPLEARLGEERVRYNLKRSLEYCRESYSRELA
jgi:sugar phosphate isomerase/epimerase